MVEAVYNASGLGLPIVMTVANRAIGAPINIWNDHSDAMSQRDSGWIQLYAEDNQEAVDLHLQAFRLAEGGVVAGDGVYGRVRADPRCRGGRSPESEVVDQFLPPYEPRQILDPAEPVSIGAMVGPEAFLEVRYLAHVRQMQALEVIPTIAREFGAATGRERNGLVSQYRMEDAVIAIVALGSVIGTLEGCCRRVAGRRGRVGVPGHHVVPPFPIDAVRQALAGSRMSSCWKSWPSGIGSIVSLNVRTALAGQDHRTVTVIAGLGGRPILKSSLAQMITNARAGELPELSFLDLRRDLVERELARARAERRSGPAAENILRDIADTGTHQGGRPDERPRALLPGRLLRGGQPTP